MTNEKAKAILKAVSEGNVYKAMMEMPECARCEEVDFLISQLAEKMTTIKRIRQQITAINFED